MGLQYKCQSLCRVIFLYAVDNLLRISRAWILFLKWKVGCIDKYYLLDIMLYTSSGNLVYCKFVIYFHYRSEGRSYVLSGLTTCATQSEFYLSWHVIAYLFDNLNPMWTIWGDWNVGKLRPPAVFFTKLQFTLLNCGITLITNKSRFSL